MSALSVSNQRRLDFYKVVQVQIKEKNQSSATLGFVRRIHRWPVNSPHKKPVTRKCLHLLDKNIVYSVGITPKRRGSIASALELRLFYNKPSLFANKIRPITSPHRLGNYKSHGWDMRLYIIENDNKHWGETGCTWSRHQMETFSALLAPCEGIHRSPMDSPHKGQWRGTLVSFLSAPEQTVEQTIETPMIWDAIALIITSL